MPATVTRPRSSEPFAGATRAIERACESERTPTAVLEAVATQIRRAMPVDAIFTSATDPDTGLPLGAGLAVGLPSSICDPFWDYEFGVPDFNKFTDLVARVERAADLHAATGGRPERSPRWREFKTHGEFDAELRATFCVGERAWGLLHLNRTDEHGAFTAAETAFVASVAPIVGRALRRAAVTFAVPDPAGRGRGMLVLDTDYKLLSASDEAAAWFEEIDSYGDGVEMSRGLRVPPEIIHVAQIAQARVNLGLPSAASTRMRTVGGGWLLVHASCMTGRHGVTTAVVIERAAGKDMAPLLMEAYELTQRELDVTHAVARGLSTADIGRELHVSRYTVQDHLKRIFEKAGVTTRGELMARLYHDRFQPHMDVVHL